MRAGSGALRRRRKRSIATRLRVFWVFIVCILGAAGYAVYAFITLPALRVQAIDVHLDGSAVTEREVLQAASIDPDENVWLLNTARIAQRIEAIPYVESAIVQRVPPARLTVEVTQRVPVACVRSAGRVVTIDRSRRILQTGCAEIDPLFIDLHDTVLGGAGSRAGPPVLATLLADAQALSEANLGIRSIEQNRFGELVAVQTSGVALLFGSDADLPQKAQLVAPVLAAAPPGHAVRAIDLRAPTTPTVQFR